MKKWIAVFMLCLLPIAAQSQEAFIQVWDREAKLAVNSSIMAIVKGPNTGTIWTNLGVSYRVAKINEAHLAMMFQAVKIEDQEPTGYGFSVLWIEPVFGLPWMDCIFEIGGSSKIAAGDAGERDWARIVGVALNVHFAPQASAFIGGKVFDAQPGKLKAAGIGGGIVLYSDSWLSKLWPGKD